MKKSVTPTKQLHSAECLVRHIAASFAFAILLTLGLIAPNLNAQTTIKPAQFRVEVQTGFSGTILLTNNVMRVATNGATVLDGTGTNWVIPSVAVSIAGAPAGVTASLTDITGNPVATVPVNMNTNNASQSSNLVVKLVFNGAQSSGISTLGISMIGALTNGYFPITLEVGKIWNGSANVAANGSGNWSDATKWLGGVPGPNDNVVFTDLGTQTNSLVGGASLLSNSVVDVDVVISSLRFSQTNGAGAPLTNWHNIYINDGKTLAIKGNAGFSLLKDYPFWIPKLNVSISGTNGTFIQTNENSSFALLSDGANAANAFTLLDMSRLGSCFLDVNNVNIGDIFGFPNYFYFRTNLFSSGTTQGASIPQRIQPTWTMALTNYVKAVYVDPFNYNNASARSYAIEIGRNELTAGSSGDDMVMLMGLTNSFNIDGICIGGAFVGGGVLRFNTTNSYAKFRGISGGRMTAFTCGDAAGTVSLGGSVGANTKCGNSGFGVDFTKGTVDILVDRFYMSRDRGQTTGSGITQSSLGMASGVIDANTAYIGSQESGNQTNQNSCTAALTVSNTATFKVNGTLALGYTTASVGDPSLPGSTKGTLTIGPGGTLIASNITVGGTTKASAGNIITMSGNATLIVSNRIADSSANGALGTLAFSGGNNTIKVFINGANPSPIIYVTNFTAAGTGNKLLIGGVTGLTYPADVVIVQGAGVPAISASAFDAGVVMPPGSGLSGSLSTSSSNTINVRIINRSPNVLTWRGPTGVSGTADWDYLTKNWLNTNGVMTNYDNPDIVSFDGASGFATNINVVGSTMTPTIVNVTNGSLLKYTLLDGSGTIAGGPSLNKQGAGVVQIEANTTLSPQVNQGSVTGAGQIANASVATGATLNFSGNLSGSLQSAGVATSSGTISGTLTVQSGGVVTNSGTVNGLIAVQSGGYLYNSGSLPNIGLGTVGSPQVASGATFVNRGSIGQNLGNNVLFVSGTFIDLGVGGSDSLTLQSLTVGSGGVFYPGGGTSGTTVINSDGTGTFPGAALLVQNSTNVFMLNGGTGSADTVLQVNNLSFGGSASARSQSGATIQIVNSSLTPFSAGQSFHMFDNVNSPGSVPFNTGSSTNTYPVITPASPGNGLAWDLSQLWVSGNIRVVLPSSGPVLNLSTVMDNSTGTNRIINSFSWDSSYLGYRLQTQNNPLSVGLSTNWSNATDSGTNLVDGGPSWTRTSISITNTITGSNAVFYRLSFP